MKKLVNNIAPHFFALLIIVVVVVYALQYIATEPWRQLPDIGGDGAKNNFTYLYHALHGQGYWFTGMNYPYGEHIVYTDGLPLLSIFLASIGHVSAPTALTLLWWSIGLSYVLSMWYLFRIFRHYQLPWLPALIFACCAGLMAPQILRLKGHYALSFVSFVPMLFYFTIQYYQSGRWRYGIYIALLGLMHAALHPYYLALLLIWCVTYCVAYLLCTTTALRVRLQHLLVYGICCALPIIAFTMVMRLTDTISDRPSTPFIDKMMFAKLAQMFTSFCSPIWQWVVSNKWLPKVADGGEGFNYVGIVALLAVGGWSMSYVVRRFLVALRRRPFIQASPQLQVPVLWMLMATGIMMFSAGIPFVWRIEWAQHLSLFKQFRSLGRFSWLYYYLMVVLAGVILWQVYLQLQQRTGKAVATVFIVCSAAVWATEAYGYAAFSRSVSQVGAYNYDETFAINRKSWQTFLEENHHLPSDFEAVLALSYYHVGSEKLWLGTFDWLNSLTVRCALQLQLPVVDVMMSRTSLAQTMSQVKIAGGPLVDKPLLHQLSTHKPLLLLHYEADSLDAYQQWLLTASKPLGQFSQCTVYAFYPDSLLHKEQLLRDSILATASLLAPHNAVVTPTSDTFFYHHFNEGAVAGVSGMAMPAALSSDTLLFTLPTVGYPDSVSFSSWFLRNPDVPVAPFWKLVFLDGAGKEIANTDVLAKESTDNYKGWFRAYRLFRIPKGCKRIACSVVAEWPGAYLAVDEVLMQAANSTVIYKNDKGTIFANNHVINTK